MNATEPNTAPLPVLRSHWPLTVFTSLSAVCNLALPLVLVRVFDTEAVGHYKLFFLYLALMPWLTLSAGVINGLYHWGGKVDFKSYFQSSWSLLLCWSSFVSVILALCLRSEILGFWFILGTFLTLLATFHEEALVASGRTWRGGLFSAVFEICRTATVLFVALKTRDLNSLIQAYVITLAVKVMLGYYFGRKLDFQRFVNVFATHSEVTRSTLVYAIPVSFGSLIAVFTHYADQLAVSHFTDVAYFAGYTLGCLSIPPLNSLEQSVNRVLIPTLRRETPQLLRDATAELSWILIPAATGLLIFAHPIVELIFTEKFSWVAIFLRLYAFNYLLMAFPYDAWPRASGDGKWILKNLIVAAAVAMITIPALTYLYQGVGALIGLLACQLSLRIGGMIYIRNSTDWKMRDYIPFAEIFYQLSVCLVLALACYGAAYALGNGLRWFLVCGPIFALIYLSLTTRRRLSLHFKERSKPAVLQMSQYLEMGGLERVIFSLCTAYQSTSQVDSFVMSYDIRPHAKSLREEFESIGVRVITEHKKAGFSPAIVLKLIRLCHRERIGLIHTHDLGPLLYAVMAKILTFGALRVVHTQHSFIHLTSRRRHRLYEQVFTRFADALIIISADAKKTYVELGLSPQRMTLISNGVFFPGSVLSTPAERLEIRKQLQPNIDASRTWFLYLARIHSQKGQVHAIELWNRLSPETRERSLLVFVGQESSFGELEKLTTAISKYNLQSSVAFAGVSLEPMKWLQAADAFISLSEFEGMPLSPIEAYGSGLPVILSKIAGHESLPADCIRENIEAKIAQIATLDADALITQRTKAYHAAALFRKEHGIDEMAAHYLKVYQRVRK